MRSPSRTSHPGTPRTAELDGRVAVVTGGSRGVGQAIARSLAAAGAAVAVVARSGDEVRRTAEAIRAVGGNALGVRADVSDQRAVRDAVSETERILGPIDVLVNNAARATVVGPTWQVDPDEWWREVEVDLRGPFLCAHAVLPGMIGRGRGTIVNLVSNMGLRPSPYATAYAASKAALLRLTDSLAEEVGEHGIQVFAISPGFVRTGLSEPMSKSPLMQRWASPLPPGADESQRWTSPDRAAALVVYLATGQAGSLSGRFIHASEDAAKLVEQAAVIRERDLRALRLS